MALAVLPFIFFYVLYLGKTFEYTKVLRNCNTYKKIFFKAISFKIYII